MHSEVENLFTAFSLGMYHNMLRQVKHGEFYDAEDDKASARIDSNDLAGA